MNDGDRGAPVADPAPAGAAPQAAAAAATQPRPRWAPRRSASGAGPHPLQPAPVSTPPGGAAGARQQQDTDRNSGQLFSPVAAQPRRWSQSGGARPASNSPPAGPARTPPQQRDGARGGSEQSPAPHSTPRYVPRNSVGGGSFNAAGGGSASALAHSTHSWSNRLSIGSNPLKDLDDDADALRRAGLARASGSGALPSQWEPHHPVAAHHRHEGSGQIIQVVTPTMGSRTNSGHSYTEAAAAYTADRGGGGGGAGGGESGGLRDPSTGGTDTTMPTLRLPSLMDGVQERVAPTNLGGGPNNSNSNSNGAAAGVGAAAGAPRTKGGSGAWQALPLPAKHHHHLHHLSGGAGDSFAGITRAHSNGSESDHDPAHKAQRHHPPGGDGGGAPAAGTAAPAAAAASTSTTPRVRGRTGRNQGGNSSGSFRRPKYRSASLGTKAFSQGHVPVAASESSRHLAAHDAPTGGGGGGALAVPSVLARRATGGSRVAATPQASASKHAGEELARVLVPSTSHVRCLEIDQRGHTHEVEPLETTRHAKVSQADKHYYPIKGGVHVTKIKTKHGHAPSGGVVSVEGETSPSMSFASDYPPSHALSGQVLSDTHAHHGSHRDEHQGLHHHGLHHHAGGHKESRHGHHHHHKDGEHGKHGPGIFAAHQPRTHSIQSLFRRRREEHVVKHVHRRKDKDGGSHATASRDVPSSSLPVPSGMSASEAEGSVSCYTPAERNASRPGFASFIAGGDHGATDHHYDSSIVDPAHDGADPPVQYEKVLRKLPLRFKGSDTKLGVRWQGTGRGEIIVADVTPGMGAQVGGMTKGMRLVSIDGVQISDKGDLLRLIGENGVTDDKLRRGQMVIFELEDLVLRALPPRVASVSAPPQGGADTASAVTPPCDDTATATTGVTGGRVGSVTGTEDGKTAPAEAPADAAKPPHRQLTVDVHDVRIDVASGGAVDDASGHPPLTPRMCLSSPDSKLSRRSDVAIPATQAQHPVGRASRSPSPLGSLAGIDNHSVSACGGYPRDDSPLSHVSFREGDEHVDDDGDSTDSSSYDVEYTFPAILPFHRTIEAVTIPFLAAVVPRTLFYEIPLAVGSIGTFWTLIVLVSTLVISLLSLNSISCFLCKKSSAAGDSESCTPYKVFTRHVGTEYGGIVGILYWLVLVMLCSIAVQFAGQWACYNIYTVADWDVSEIAGGNWRAHMIFIGIGILLQLLCFVLVRASYQYIVLVETYIFLVNVAALICFIVFITTFSDTPATADVVAPSADNPGDGLFYFNSSFRLSSATFADNWITEVAFNLPPDSATTIPETFRKSLIETYCRIFPATIGILIVLGRATDLQEPEKELPRSTAWTLLFTYLVFIGYALWIGASLTPNWHNYVTDAGATANHTASGAAVPSVAVPRDGGGSGGARVDLFGMGEATLAPPSAADANTPKHALFDLFRGMGGGAANHSILIWVVEFLIVTNTIGNMIQVLSIAPFVVSAMANDHITNLLNPFQVEDGEVFPRQALMLSAALCIPLSISEYFLYPLTTITSLICLVIINGVAAFSVFMEPNMFDRTLGFYSWRLSFIGFIFTLFAVFAVKWYVTLSALIIVLIGARYLEMRSDFSSWGEGLKGVHLQHALEKLRALESTKSKQSKNWRPQLMVLTKVDGDGYVAHPRLLAVADQMKAGKGLVVYCAIVEGDLMAQKEHLKTASDHLDLLKCQKCVTGFTRVIAAPTFAQGANFAMQGLGLGALSPNTVLCLWPDDWRVKPGVSTEFTHLLHIANSLSKAVIVVKGLDAFPDPNDETDDVMNVPMDRDHIDLWWIAHDGGIELLIALLLRQNMVWRNTELRIFTIIPAENDAHALSEELAAKLGRMRMHALLIVHPVEEEWIKEFTCPHEAEVRQRAMDEAKLTEDERRREVDQVLFNHHKRATSSRQMTGQTQPRSQSGAFSPVDNKQNSTTGSVQNDTSNTGFEGFPMVELVGDGGYPDTTADPTGGQDYRNSPSYHFACLNRLILEHSDPHSDLVLISLPEASNFTTPDEFMDCMETMLHGLRKAIMIRGTGEQIITGYW